MNTIKKVFNIFLGLLITTAVVAQPASLKKAGKSLFVLKTFDEANRLMGSTNGFYVGNNGEGVSCYQPMKGAHRAVVIGSDGKERQVECILGANETYDVVKFKVADVKSIPLATSSSALRNGSLVWQMPQKDIKKMKMGTVRRVEKFNTDYNYYTVALKMAANTEGSPLFNDEGFVVGIMERPAFEGDTLSYAVSAAFANDLKINGLSINDPVLRAIRIKKDLPQEVEQAVVSLYLGASTQDSATYATMIDDFIKRFPTSPDGYYYRSLQSFKRNDFAAIQKDMELSIQQTEQKDVPHYNYSRFIYEKEIQKPQVSFDVWSLDKALTEAQEAYAFNPLPEYRHQQAVILYAQQKYQEASDFYAELSKGPLRSATIFHEASKCRIMLGDTIGQLALLDSALATFNRPLLRNAAPFLLARSQAYLTAGKYREAVFDLNEYEGLMKNQLNDRFYYLRHQADLGGRLFQQALNDINKAIELRPDYDVYLSEKASLLVRVGMLEDAISTARQLIELSPTQSDGFLFLGLAQCMKGEKTEGLTNLKKALDMGDPQAEDLMKRFE